MSKEKIIEFSSWIILLTLLFWVVPVERIREALVIFFFKQSLTWLSGLLVVQMGFIEYPLRIFPKATRSSFTFEFFAYPVICIFFNLYYPFGESVSRQILHYFAFTSAITLIEYILEKHTQLIKYIKWAWYWTWLTLLITFVMSNFFYRWFFSL
ncbi:MAG TPA: hypothetical protein DER60_02080 [Syntrophomonas sp.]|jgi:hypothetical protein|nr:hypothetical protein [Syntrophomonas sp.]